MKSLKLRTCIAALIVGVVIFLGAERAQADLLISNPRGNNVLRFDTTTGAFLGVFASGEELLSNGGPRGLTFGPDGNLYVTTNVGKVLRYGGRTGAFIDVFAFECLVSALVVGPDQGLAFGPDGNLYASAYQGNRILRYDGATGGCIGELVSPATSELRAPVDLAFGPDGDLYVTTGLHQVQRYDITTGRSTGAFWLPGELGFLGPRALTFGLDGNLYVSNQLDSVARFNPATTGGGGFIDLFVSSGSGGLLSPTGLTFGPDGNLYVLTAGVGGQIGVLRYDGRTGAFLDTFVAPGSGGLAGVDLAAPPFLIFTSQRSGTNITVNNFSFEELPVGGLPHIGYLGGTFSIAPIPGWVNSGDSGQFQPGTGGGAYFNTLSDGPTVGYSNGGTISQTVGATVQAGVVYTLRVDVGLRNDACCQTLGTVQLLIGDTVIQATGRAPAQGSFSTLTATYTGLPADVGKPITIQLSATAQQGDFDNVRLTAQTPETLVVNGSFEEPLIPSGDLALFPSIPGWQLASGCSIEVQAGVAGTPQEGRQFVELDSTCSSGIFQELPTTAGQEYELRFFFSPRPISVGAPGGVADNRLIVKWDGAVVAELTASGVGLPDTVWTEFVYRVTASSSVTRLEFQDGSVSDTLGTYVDNVGVTAVGPPPPAGPSVRLEQLVFSNLLPRLLNPVIAEGGVIPHGRVKFEAVVDLPGSGDVCVEIEVRSSTESFQGEPNLDRVCGLRGDTLGITTAPQAPGEYRWRARVLDNGSTGPWMDFGDPAKIDYVILPPVVLVHGWCGSPDERTWGAMDSLLQSALFTGPAGSRVDESGRLITAAHMVEYRADKIGDLTRLAGVLAERIAIVMRVFDAVQVDVVAHSMGGLVTRAWIAGMGVDENEVPVEYHDEVRRLVTIATPHYGTPAGQFLSAVPDLFFSCPGRLRVHTRQASAMEFGSHFLWVLHNNWARTEFGSSGKDRILSIVGTGFDPTDQSDFVVPVESATLPDLKRTRYVDRGHFSSIVDIDSTEHETYKLVDAFLAAQDLSAPTSDACEVPVCQREVPVNARGLLLMRLVDPGDRDELGQPSGINLRRRLVFVELDPSTGTTLQDANPQASTVTLYRVRGGSYDATVLVTNLRARALYGPEVVEEIVITPGRPKVVGEVELNRVR